MSQCPWVISLQLPSSVFIKNKQTESCCFTSPKSNGISSYIVMKLVSKYQVIVTSSCRENRCEKVGQTDRQMEGQEYSVNSIRIKLIFHFIIFLLDNCWLMIKQTVIQCNILYNSIQKWKQVKSYPGNFWNLSKALSNTSWSSYNK